MFWELFYEKGRQQCIVLFVELSLTQVLLSWYGMTKIVMINGEIFHEFAVLISYIHTCPQGDF
jgi:hypothetical protein